MTSLRQRFLEKIISQNGHWLWTGAVSNSGYGNIGEGGRKGRTLKAHSLSYEIFVEPIPSGLIICHLCDIKLCVKPGHLYAGTYADNYSDRVERGDGGMKPPYDLYVRDKFGQFAGFAA